MDDLDKCFGEEGDENQKRGRRKEYRLTSRERNWADTGEAGTDRPSRLQKNIRDKRDLLDARFRDLFEDIEVLDREGYFEPQEWEDGWRDLMRIGKNRDLQEEFIFEPRHEPMWSSTPAFRFGKDLGEMVRQLMLYPQGIEDENVWSDLILGFIEELCFTEWDDHPRIRGDYMESLLEKVKHKSEIRFNEIATEEEEFFEKVYGGNNPREKLKEEIRDAISESGEIPYEEHRQIRLLSSDIFHILAENQDSREPEMEEEITPTLVERVVDEHDLLIRRELSSKINQDIQNLRKIESNDIKGTDIIGNFPEVIGTATSREIALSIGGSDGSVKKNLPEVVKLCLCLSDERDMDGLNWSSYNLLKRDIGSPDEYGKREWELTEYGKAVKSIYRQRSQSVSSTYSHIEASEFFESALIEFRKQKEE
jgi:hypothetical protein